MRLKFGPILTVLALSALMALAMSKYGLAVDAQGGHHKVTLTVSWQQPPEAAATDNTADATPARP